MGQKVNPISIRLGITRSWDSIWYSDRNYQNYLKDDLWIRDLISKKFQKSGIVQVLIQRLPKSLNISIHTVRPGMVIGQRGGNIDALRQQILNRPKLMGENTNKVSLHINIVEVKKPETIAQTIADTVAGQLEQRRPFRRVMKQAIRGAMRGKVLGVKIAVAGRLNGADMARTEQYKEGRVPLHTLRANIDYAQSIAQTTYGTIGVKVWIYKDETVAEDKKKTDSDFYLVKRKTE